MSTYFNESFRLISNGRINFRPMLSSRLFLALLASSVAIGLVAAQSGASILTDVRAILGNSTGDKVLFSVKNFNYQFPSILLARLSWLMELINLSFDSEHSQQPRCLCWMHNRPGEIIHSQDHCFQYFGF